MSDTTGPLLLDAIDDEQHATNVRFFRGLADVAETMFDEPMTDEIKDSYADTAAGAVQVHDPLGLVVVGSMLMHAGQAGAQSQLAEVDEPVEDRDDHEIDPNGFGQAA